MSLPYQILCIYLVFGTISSKLVTVKQMLNGNQLGWNCQSEYQPTNIDCDFTEPRFYYYGLFGTNDKCILQIQDLLPHYSLSTSVDLLYLHRWDDLPINFLIDDQLIISKNFKLPHIYTYGKRKYCENGGTFQNIIFNPTYLDEYNGITFQIGYNQTHADSNLKYELNANLNYPIEDGQWAFSNFIVQIDTCHQSCKSCTGPDSKDCIDCIDGAQKSNEICKCDNEKYAFQYQCIDECTDGYISDDNHSCIEVCSVENCQECEEVTDPTLQQTCKICENNFYNLNGRCYGSCPFWSEIDGTICKETSAVKFTDIPRPIIVEDLTLKKHFFHGDIFSSGWQVKQIEERKTVQFASQKTDEKSLAFGMGWSAYRSGDQCKDEVCFIKKNFENLPQPHYKLEFRAYIVAGGQWQGEDGGQIDYIEMSMGGETMKNITTFDQEKWENDNIDAGGWDSADYVYEEFLTMDHTADSAEFSFTYRKRRISMKNWIGFRDLRLMVYLCDNPLCITCSQSGQNNCDSCEGTIGEIFSRILNQGCRCPSGYSSYGGTHLCLECVNNLCDTCQNQDQCHTCVGTQNKDFSRDPSNLCECPVSYENKTGQDDCVIICKPSCLKCLIDQTCIQCSGNSKTMVKDCYDCTTIHCKTCDSWGVCIQCNDVHKLQSDKTCKLTTYLCNQNDCGLVCIQGQNQYCQKCEFQTLNFQKLECSNCQQVVSQEAQQKKCGACEQYRDGCSECSISYDTCISCKSGRTIQSQCLCQNEQIFAYNSDWTECQQWCDVQNKDQIYGFPYTCVTCLENQIKTNGSYKGMNNNDDIKQSICLTCHTSCLSCDFINSPIYGCKSCKQQNKVVNDDKQQCICKQGYILQNKNDLNSECLKTGQECSNKQCLTCYSQNQQCLKCIDQNQILPNCICKPGHQFLNNQCQKIGKYNALPRYITMQT